jgi:8-oxo-dGTP pyrophosphatase MutT (NUDIX family)
MAAANGGNPIIDAATVVVARTGANGLEVLMLHKHTGHAFGGMWVFPGGRVDPDDPGGNELERARHAAVREAAEEASIVVAAEDLVAFAHWTPPPEAPRRFATWFFLVEARHGHEVVVDGGEIADHAWVRPSEALERQGRGEIELAPPTWISLHGLLGFTGAADAIDAARRRDVTYYATRIGSLDGALVALWDGDAGYATADATVAGARHRLVMRDGVPWVFEG